MATRGALSTFLSPTDESRYRKEVLRLDEDAETTEDSIEAQLVAEASELGLRIPEIQIAASLAATINAGILDFTIPVPSSSSSSTAATGSTHHQHRPSFTHPRSFADLVRSSVASVDQLATSLSETTVSDRDHSGSIPSIDSLSTRPTSISSCDVRIISPQGAVPHERTSWVQSPQQIYSPASTSASASAFRLAERKRSSFISAIGRPFRKRRTPSAVNLPPNAHISLKKNESGGANTVIVETKPARAVEAQCPEDAQSQGTLQVEVPVFDEAATNRTKEDAQLNELLERHRAERSRFVQLQTELLDSLKAAHLAAVAEQRLSNSKAEQTKKEWNTDFLARMEERQLSVEIDQIKEFEKSKRNSQTRIKYMEGYVSTSSPPPSPQLSGSEFEPIPNGAQQQQQQLRTVTRRQKEQLAQEYLDRNSMDRLHEARIKVLRERQEQQLQETASRLERELESLINKNADAIVELERDHQRAEQQMLQVFEAKKDRLRRRWNIEEAILRKRLEDQSGLPYGPLPIVSFSTPDDEEGRHSNDREFFEFEIPILKNPFASTTKES